MKRPDFSRVDELDRQRAREQPVDYERNLRIYEALYQEAVALGVWGKGDRLAGLEHDIRYARVINAARPPRKDRQGP